MKRKKDKSEDYVWDIISRYGNNPERWQFVEMDEGNSAQAVNIGGCWFSYPDYKKQNSNKTKSIMLVEVKGYDEYFANIEYGLGIKVKQFKSYSKIQYEEQCQVRVCFVIWMKDGIHLFWETLNNMKNMEKMIKKDYSYSPFVKSEDYYVFDCREFRTDFENLPRFAWDE